MHMPSMNSHGGVLRSSSCTSARAKGWCSCNPARVVSADPV